MMMTIKNTVVRHQLESATMPLMALSQNGSYNCCDEPDVYDDDCECANCGTCVCDQPIGGDNYLWGYSYKPFGSHYVDYLNGGFVILPITDAVESDMVYGMELEVEYRLPEFENVRTLLTYLNAAFGSHQSDSTAVWIGKEDSTVDVEFVSMPFTYRAWQAAQPALAIAMEFAQAKFRAFYAESAGGHIHVSKSLLSLTTMYAWIQFHYNNPGLIADIAQRSIGTDAEWCYLQKPDIPVAQIAKQKYGFPGRGALADSAHTIEHRYFRSNLRIERLNKNVEFLQSMFDYFSKLTYQDMARDGAHKLVGYLGHVSLNQATYPNLYTYLQKKGYISCV